MDPRSPDAGHAPDPTARAMGAHRAGWLAVLGTLKARLTLAALLAMFAGMALITWKIDHAVTRDLVSTFEAHEREEARQTVRSLAHRAEEMQRALAAVAAQVDARVWSDLDALDTFMTDRVVLRGLFSNVAVVDREGRIRIIGDAVGTRRPDARIGDRAYFRQTMESGEPMIAGPIPGRVSGEPVLMFTHPLVVEGERVGLLGAALRLASRDLLAEYIEEGPVADATIVVTDAAGQVLAHPRRDRIGTSIDDLPGFEPAARAWAADGRERLEEPRSWHAGDTIVGAAGDARTGWHVWRSVPIEMLAAPVRQARNEALAQAALLAAGLGLALVAWLLHLLRPLAQLERRAHALLAGDADAEWPAAGGEIGQLARTLQHVAAERREAERRNQRVLEQLHSVMASAPVGLAFTRDRRFELVSAQMCRLMGVTPQELQGQPAQQIFDSADDYAALGPKVAAAFARGDAYDGEHPMRRRDGGTFWGHLRARPVVMDDPSAGTIWSLADATAQVAARRQLEHAALHDPLTGIANRKAFDHALATAAGQARGGHAMSLLMVDLDRFKPINDSAGHAAGDAMLRHVSQVLVRHVRERDVVARLGGDEFGLLLDGCDAERAQTVAEKIRRAVASIALPWEGRELTVGASLGVATWSPDRAAPADWLAAADAACYAAKHAGRNTVRATAPVVPLRRPAAGS
jgi:diguanylate cyclase